MARKKTVEDVSEEALQEPAGATEEPSNELPAAEAIAEAVALQEDAEAVQVSLFPRPPFDHRAALLEISTKEQDVSELAAVLERAKRAHKLAKDDWDEASTELAALIRRHVTAMRESEREPEPHQLSLEGEGCVWEREHPGEVCMVCAQSRAAVRGEQPADEPVVEPATSGEAVAH